jgi:tRNA(Ile)-lysidine synthase TilS/MesJ
VRNLVEEAGYKVVAVVFFREREVARFATREQAEWKAQELNEQSERNPRGYVRYLVQPVEEPRKD